MRRAPMSRSKLHHGASSKISFDPSAYPRVYSVSPRYQTYWTLAALAFAVGGPSLIWSSHGMKALQKLIVSAPLVLLGVYLVLEVTRLKVILEPHAITVLHTFSKHKMQRCDIAGQRTGNAGRGTTTRILVPRDGGQKVLKFPEIMENDPEFVAWFSGIPHLNS